MKKVRMIVSAVAVFAVVGGALAFSPNRSSSFCVRDLVDGSGTCERQLDNQQEITPGTTYFGVIKGSAACTSTQCNNQITLAEN